MNDYVQISRNLLDRFMDLWVDAENMLKDFNTMPDPDGVVDFWFIRLEQSVKALNELADEVPVKE